MQVILASLGGGRPETMTAECADALQQADCILGAKRLLENLPQGCTENRVAAIKPQDLLDVISCQQGDCVVVYSGDAGFYSGARGLLPLLSPAFNCCPPAWGGPGRIGSWCPPTGWTVALSERSAGESPRFSSPAGRWGPLRFAGG